MVNNKLKKIVLVCLISFSFIVLMATSITTFAYFTTRVKVYTNDGGEDYARIGMRLNLLFDHIDKKIVSDGTDLLIPNKSGMNDPYGIGASNSATTFHYDSTATWGSAHNPYIISNVKHLQNLSALQDVGYFESLLAEFDSTENNGTTSIPYFLICKPDGSPVTIDGTGKSIKPIGNDDYPFVGYVGGAFVEGDAKSDTQTLSCDDSVVYNIKIETTTDQLDVGLFGSIGYLGDESEADEYTIDTVTLYGFPGAITTITNFAIYDVQVIVSNPTFAEKIADLVSRHPHVTYASGSNDTAHENHHIGIMAGHVEYTAMSYISVYYGDMDVKAIDLTHTNLDADGAAANYYSQSGILGFIYNMNPDYIAGYIAPNDTSGSQTAIEDAEGTGGGLLSGEGRGYVTAKKIYNLYSDEGIVVKYLFDDIPDDEIDTFYTYYSLLLVKQNGKYYLARKDTTNNRYIADTDVEVTVNVGIDASIDEQYSNFWGQTQTKSSTWTDFIVLDGSTYYHKGDASLVVTSEITETKLLLKYGYNYGEDDVLCTQWIRQRLLIGTQATDEYYFTDGVFTFALSSNLDIIENTWETTVDKFSIGLDDDDAWKKNISQGNKAIVAYVRQIKDNKDLAANANRPLFIMALDPDEKDGAGTFLMTLNSTSTQDSNNIYYTNGKLLQFGNEEYIESLANGYDSGEIDTAPVFTGINYTTNQIVNNLQSSIWQAIDVGSSENLDLVRRNYQIKAHTTTTAFYNLSANGEFTGLTCSVNNNGTGSYSVYKSAEDEDIKWAKGYYYLYVNQTSKNSATATLTYVNADGTSRSIQSGRLTSENALQTDYLDLFHASSTPKTNEYGQNVYTLTYTTTGWGGGSTTTYPAGILVTGDNKHPGVYFSEDGYELDVSQSNYVYPKNVNDYLYTYATYDFPSYIYQVDDQGGVKYYYYNGTELEEPEFVEIVDNGNTKYYRYRAKEVNSSTYRYGALLDKFNYFELSNLSGSNYQYLVYKTESSCVTSYSTYNLYCGSSVSGFSGSQKQCQILFDINGYCKITYTYHGSDTDVSRGIFYDKAENSDDSKFSSSLSGSKLAIFVLEATQETKYGRVTYDAITPIDGTENPTVLDADKYVLWPSNNSPVGSTTSADPSYYVVSLNNLKYMERLYYNLTGDVINGWLDGDGATNLSYATLHKKFQMQEGITTAYAISLLNGTLNSDGFLTAPVGSLGTEANIPKGAVAFRVNKSNPEGLYVRVIVCCPTSYYYQGHTEYNLSWASDYYLALWHTEAAGDQTITQFSSKNCMEKIELPRSNSYDPENYIDDANANYITAIYDANGNGTYEDSEKNYRSYLNGGQILVAYSFKVTEEGVYVLGTANDNNSDTMFPMEICYFSVDAAASAGRDGAVGSYLGTIDYVYDNGERIITVSDHSDDGGVEDYTQYYYASLIRTYTNNLDLTSPYNNLDDMAIQIKRDLHNGVPVTFLETSKSDYDYMVISRYNDNGDTFARKDTEAGETNYSYDPSEPSAGA